MTDIKKIELPFTEEKVKQLKAGDRLFLSGYLFTARDAAHKKICEILNQGADLPVDLNNATIYYVGPTPAAPGRPIGAAGPTTSYRMDPYVEPLLKAGVKAMIGKGQRGKEVVKLIKKYKAIYLASIGGAGALLSACIHQADLVLFPELGPEAVYRLKVANFPVTVINDIYGNDYYQTAQGLYLNKDNS